MNAFRSDLIVEASRLTRAGRLPEATALLQRAFRGSPARGPDAASPAGQPERRVGTVIDINPVTGEALDAASAIAAGAADRIDAGDGPAAPA